MHLTKKERLSFIYQLRLLEALYPDDNAGYAQMRDALENGFASEYCGTLFALPDTLDIEECDRVTEVLEMYRAIHLALRDVGPAHPFAQHRLARFAGFDPVFEGRHGAFAEHLVQRGLYRELSEVAGARALRPMLPVYEAMVRAWSRLTRRYQLDLMQVATLLDVANDYLVEAQPADFGAEDDMEALMGEVLSFRQARPGA
ncbi:hypothetical protein D5I55_07310 [Chakrabartia godavariana]|nr:hypothetical protein D5I55_07310 [Chakrabartia godavariana]